MCGICGVAGLTQAGQAEAVVRRMAGVIRHRGPDDEGFLSAPPFTVGMRRLSIIDLTTGGQPQFNEDRTMAVILNGEIYNFRELRRELEACGHIFRTQSDTEAVVHAYEEWSQECVTHLRGMFALAVIETQAPKRGQRLFLARDRLGIKPLYYALAGNALIFASEVRAILASGLVPPRLSLPALESYLLFGSVSEPMTLVEGVFSLPPGHRAWVFSDPDGAASIQTEPYWRPAEPATDLHAYSASAARQLRPLLEEAVRLHLMADAPLGIFLSSGMDSTALAALASRERSGVHTFTVAFPEQEFSEAGLARRTAEALGTTHTELLLTGAQILGQLDHAVSALDQPSMDGVNTYFVSWAARQAGLKVALSGLGGDEVFGGYPTFRLAPRLERLRAWAGRVPKSLRAATAPLAGLVAARPDAARKLAAAWRDPQGFPHPFFHARALFTRSQADTLLNGQSPPPSSLWWAWLEEAVRQTQGWDYFSRVAWLEARSYLVNTLLRDTDAMSMAHSLEVRVPFLDHVLVEFVGRLPAAVKGGNGAPKSLLAEALSDLLPRETVAQPKRTFTLPWERWLRGPLQARVAAGLKNPAGPLRSVLNPKAVVAIWEDFLAGRTGWTRPWSLYVLNDWARRHL